MRDLQVADMDLKDQTVEIKEDVEKPNEISDTAHIKLEQAHPNDPNYGVQCDSGTRKKKLGKEVQVIHTEAERELFFCYNCNYTNCSKTCLIQHINAGKCVVKSDLDKSNFARSSNIYTCTQCDKVFKKKINLDDHILKKHSGCIASISYRIHECTDCDYKTTLKETLKLHMVAHHGADSKLNMCEHCNASFVCKKALNDHVIRKHPNCIESLSCKIYECPNCDYKTTKKRNADRHSLKHPNTASSYSPITCKHCSATYKSKESRDNHILKKHPNFSASVSRKIYECIHCEYKTTFSRLLTLHMKKHTGQTTEKLILCENCDASFKSELSLSDHIVRKHPDLIASVSFKIHECRHCAYKTTFKWNLTQHMIKHTRQRSKKFSVCCAHCDATFKCKQSLDNHILKKHPSFIASVSHKIHECIHCSYKTILKWNLAQHMVKHTRECSKELNMCCTHCDVSFESKEAFDDHIITKHLDVIQGQIQNT